MEARYHVKKPIDNYSSIAHLYQAISIWEPETANFDVHRYEDARAHMPGGRLQHFRCGFYQISLIRSGETQVRSAERTFTVSPSSLIVTGPNHVQHWKSREATDELRGYVLFFMEDFLSLSVQNHRLTQDFPFFRANAELIIPISESVADDLVKLYETILYEFRERKPEFLNIIRHHVNILLLQAKRNYQIALLTTEAPCESLVDRFKREIDNSVQASSVDNKPNLHSVSDFADSLCIHPYHLNRKIKAATGMTASALIMQSRITEAKNLLLHTNLSIGEIARRLNFSSISHFGRRFREHTQLTPRQFKKAHFVG